MLIGQKITVIGAGIGGLATAIALSARGASVRVLEQSHTISEVGAGLQISPNGLVVLDALGMGDALRSVAMQIDAVALRDYREGSPVLRLEMKRHAPDQEYLVVHRADLIDLLVKTAKASGVELDLGRKIQSVIDSGGRGGGNGAVIHFDDGSMENVGLLIGADGLNSKSRAALNGDKEPFFTGQVAWRALVPGPGQGQDHGRGHGKAGADVNLFMGPGRHLVTYPLRGGALTNIVAVEEKSAWADESWSATGDPDALRRGFSGFCPEARALLEQVETVNLWGLFRHPVAAKWTGQHIALVGDAAHPTLPFLAQGANLALEDAWVLADCLATLAPRQAFATYQLKRQSRVSKVIRAANANARNYHLRQPVLRKAAHSLLRASGFLAPRRVVRQFDWIYRHDVTRHNP